MPKPSKVIQNDSDIEKPNEPESQPLILQELESISGGDIWDDI